MAFEHKDNSGSVFKNDNRSKDTDPFYKGSGKVNGEDVWINCWLNKTKDGATYMSIKFNKKDPAPPKPQPEDFDDDEIPF